ncbi:S8 family peptidase [Rhodoplanes sp. Z2-YC6860]|uniref:S8 family peptidase n=1 Tax=Rhodoplanes sp. Z2-YC6860 TaxID=674703 RepID=UPI000834F101|nr:S8 family peptidase [Rhodoplanes sp. Z2-YC6860]
MFDKRNLDNSPISLPLLAEIDKNAQNDKAFADGASGKLEAIFDIIIDVNLEYAGGRREARTVLWNQIEQLPGVTKTSGAATPPAQPAAQPAQPPSPPDDSRFQGIHAAKSMYSQQYLFGRLTAQNIRAIVRDCEEKRRKGGSSASPLYRVWLDHAVQVFTNKSISTVKADAARNAFGTLGKDIVWAVADTGVDGKHPHFKLYDNLGLDAPLEHRDFTPDSISQPHSADQACTDKMGHGTHVAGIIAGYFTTQRPTDKDGNPLTAPQRIEALVQRRDESGNQNPATLKDITTMSGMAPACKILSLKVLDDSGRGNASNLIAALEYIQELNGDGRRIRIHGVNLSVGYDFEPKWFACGQSPLCIEVNRLVRSGVVVVVAAGNTGYGQIQSAAKGPTPAGLDLTINDPGNADLAITVGSTHRDMPHVYGVSYFSSKGPTGDGRLKPDLVAPGEKIISCASGDSAEGAAEATTDNAIVAKYKEDSGTSMAAPHVSGVIAAFLSARREFVGQPEAVKDIFLSTATDLKRAVYFQGKGLVDLMRAIQSV